MQVLSAILKPLGQVQVPGAKQFIAADHFRKDNKEGVKFGKFNNNFLEFIGKVETKTTVRPAKLNRYKLLQPSADGLIRQELEKLGGKFETFLVDLWALLVKQPNGERYDGQDNVLFTDGWLNIFCMHSSMTAFAFWRNNGWCLFEGSLECSGGHQVFGRQLLRRKR